MARKSNGRSAAGTGTIRKKVVTRNGQSYEYWEARLTTGYDPGTGKQIQRSFSGKTQKEVREKMQSVVVEVNNGTYKEPSKMTVGEWLDIWMADYLNGVKPMTVLNYTRHINNKIKPALGAIRLETLTTPMVQRFYNDLGKPSKDRAALAAKTIKCVHAIFHKALQQAVSVGYIRTNPTDACELPRVERKEISPLDSGDISAFLKVVKGNQFEAVYQTALFTGMRRGETLGLTWDCVDMDAGTILVNKQLQNIPGQPGAFRLVSTKNGKGRTIVIAAYILEVLRRQKVKQAEDRLRAGELWRDNGYVFTNAIGEHLSPHTVYHEFKRLVEAIGRPDTRFHDLRHSYAVAAIQSGDDIKTVQNNLGHATASFTLDVYGHVTDEMQKASAARMEKFIQGVSG